MPVTRSVEENQNEANNRFLSAPMRASGLNRDVRPQQKEKGRAHESKEPERHFAEQL